MTEERKESHASAETVREVLEVVSDRIPNLLRDLFKTLYSKDSAENMGDAIGTFYKKLVESGIPEKDALEMARGYMINLKDVIGKGIRVGHGGAGTIKINREGKGKTITIETEEEEKD
ncbi:hypothetical protein M1O13_00950 [Dehalococcoidia bacterium]|nr:hypothetical protein [Dehalococcoidia bacterium]MCL0090558.1 hypothetical protein [Dehalococcoidia bacterium]